jgi:hypothetical protein
MSSELSSATSSKKLSHQVLIVAHVGVKMNFNNGWQVSICFKKGQIIEALALKQKVKSHFMKWGDCVSKGGKH